MRGPLVASALLFALVVGVPACAGGDSRAAEVPGYVESDGSSTVYPIAEAVAEEFQRAHPEVRVTVGVSGTGGGFQRFCNAEIDISNASRAIHESEREKCRLNGVEYVWVPVALDGLSVVVNPSNRFVTCLTVEELARIWQPGSDIRLWSQVRAAFPAEEIRLYGPGTDSGTFDYFTATVTGESGASRADYQASEDDNVLILGVAGDPYALGYFGYAYYIENSDKLTLIGVDAGRGCVEPSRETIESGAYVPLSRPLLLYVNRESLARPEVQSYVRFLFDHARELVPSTGYVPLPDDDYAEAASSLSSVVAEGR